MSRSAVNHANAPWQSVFCGLLGLVMALALLKFGNPVILQDKIVSPANLTELRVQAWPVSWGYALLGLVLSLSASVFRWQRPPVWMSALPLAWLGWQGLAGRRTVNGALTLATLEHFAACVACFYVGLFALS